MPRPTPLEDYLFDLRGFLVLQDALAPALLENLNREFDAFPRDLPRGGWYRGAQRRDYIADAGMELHHCLELAGPFTELIDNPAWIDYMRHYCGEEGSYVEGLFIDECVASIRESGGFHPLHSGGYQGALRGAYACRDGVFRCGQVNVLLALTDIGPGDGATVVVPGSHKSRVPAPHLRDYTYGGAHAGELPPAAIEAHLRAGDALLFVDGLQHGGSLRSSPGERRVIILRYGPSWGNTRYGYVYSPALLQQLTPAQRRILQPIPPCPPGSSFIPGETGPGEPGEEPHA